MKNSRRAMNCRCYCTRREPGPRQPPRLARSPEKLVASHILPKLITPLEQVGVTIRSLVTLANILRIEFSCAELGTFDLVECGPGSAPDAPAWRARNGRF